MLSVKRLKMFKSGEPVKREEVQSEVGSEKEERKRQRQRLVPVS